MYKQLHFVYSESRLASWAAHALSNILLPYKYCSARERSYEKPAIQHKSMQPHRPSPSIVKNINMPSLASSIAVDIPSSTPQTISPDNEHTKFLEKVLSAVSESIPLTPVTPASCTNKNTIATPRSRFEPKNSGKRTSISVADLLNSETPDNESEKENPKEIRVFAHNPPRLVPFKMLIRNRVNSTEEDWKPKSNPTVGELSCLSPLTPGISPGRNKSPFSSVGDMQRMETITNRAVQLPPLVLQTLSASSKRETNDGADGKKAPLNGTQQPQITRKRARDGEVSVQHQKRKRKRGPKTLKCTEPGCDILFNQPSAVRNHIRTVHRGERRFFCPEPGCDSRFGASGDVTRHVSSVHEGNRNSICTICGLRMSRSTVLYRHIRNIHRQEPNIPKIRRAAQLKDRASRRRGGQNECNLLSSDPYQKGHKSASLISISNTPGTLERIEERSSTGKHS